jgi:hypothetical protein
MEEVMNLETGSAVESAEALEGRLYEQIGNELDTQDIDKGVWTKVFSEAMGDDAKTRALYIRVRFDKLLSAESAKLEAEASSRTQDEHRFAEEARSVASDRTQRAAEFQRAVSTFLKCSYPDSDKLTEVVGLCDAGELGLDRTDLAGKTLLHYAALLGSEASATRLLKCGADPNVIDGSGLRPIDYARRSTRSGVSSGYDDVVARLKAAGARRGPLVSEVAESPALAKKLQLPSAAGATRPTSSDDGDNKERDSLYRAAVGPKNTDFYLRYFAKRDGGAAFGSWNWPALFVPFFWATHRKLWGMAGAYVGVSFLVLIAKSIKPASGVHSVVTDTSTLLWILGAIVVTFVWPVVANGLYYRKVQRLVAEAKQSDANSPARLAYLSAKGRTSLPWLIVGIVVGSLLLIGIILASAIPAFQQYRAKSPESAVSAAPISPETPRTDSAAGVATTSDVELDTTKNAAAEWKAQQDAFLRLHPEYVQDRKLFDRLNKKVIELANDPQYARSNSAWILNEAYRQTLLTTRRGSDSSELDPPTRNSKAASTNPLQKYHPAKSADSAVSAVPIAPETPMTNSAAGAATTSNVELHTTKNAWAEWQAQQDAFLRLHPEYVQDRDLFNRLNKKVIELANDPHHARSDGAWILNEAHRQTVPPVRLR